MACLDCDLKDLLGYHAGLGRSGLEAMPKFAQVLFIVLLILNIRSDILPLDGLLELLPHSVLVVDFAGGPSSPLSEAAGEAHHLKVDVVLEHGIQRQLGVANFDTVLSCAAHASDQEQLGLDVLLVQELEIEVIDVVLEREDSVDLWLVACGHVRVLGIVVEEVEGDECLNCARKSILHAEYLVDQLRVQLNFGDAKVKDILLELHLRFIGQN